MSLTYAQMGLSVASALSQHSASKHQYDMAEIQRKYRDTMSKISGAVQMNTMTQNEIAAREQAAMASISIQAQSLKDTASAAASAAAAGVRGGSVTGTMRGMMRSRLLAQEARRRKVEANAKSFQNERRNLGIATAMNNEISVLPKPSTSSALLGLGASLLNIHDSNQPEGSRMSDILSRLG